MASPEEHDRKQTHDATGESADESRTASVGGAGMEDLISGVLDEDNVSGLQSELEQALQEISKYKDLALRAEAETQNVRRRAERDVENAHRFGLEKFIDNLLPVVDSLEKAIESVEQSEGIEDAAAKAIIEGVGLCQKMLVDVLGKEGVTVVDPEGEPFDPNHHQAMAMVDASNMEPGSVVTVVQKGYMLNGRLVRPALVLVSKSTARGDAEP